MPDPTSAVVSSSASVSAPAAPAASAPVSTPSTSTSTDTPIEVSTPKPRPNFKEALKAATAPTPAASPQETAATGPDATGTETVITKPATPAGPVPLVVHQQALANARQKERAAVVAEYGQKYGDPAVVEQSMAWVRKAGADPEGYLRAVIASAARDPKLAPLVRSLAGRTLGARGMPAPQVEANGNIAPVVEARPDFQDADGNQFFSAKAHKASLDALKAEILEEMTPLKASAAEQQAQREQERQANQQTAYRAQVETQMKGYITQARTWPFFAEHEAEIKAALAAAPETGGHPAEEAVLLRQIYDSVVGPRLATLAQDKVLAQLQSRANASGINPAATGVPSGIPKSAQAKYGGSFKAALAHTLAQASSR